MHNDENAVVVHFLLYIVGKEGIKTKYLVTNYINSMVFCCEIY